MATTRYTLTCLSPVHVGTGARLGKFDGAYAEGRWWLVDLDEVLARGADADALARAMSERDFSWAAWLRDKGIAPSEVAAYALPCSGDPRETAIREALKDVHRRSYLPGTLVKGAMRTAVLWALLKQDSRLLQEATDYLALRLRSLELLQALDGMPGDHRKYSNPQAHERAVAQVFGSGRAKALCDVLHRALNKRVDRLQRSDFEQFAEWNRRRNRLQPNSRYLDDPIERFALGRDPNHDLLRAVQVGDSAPVGLERLAVGLIRTYTLRSDRLVEERDKTFVEWLVPETTLRLSVRLDNFLFTAAANRLLRLRGEGQRAVEQLAQTCNAYARAVIDAEKAFYGAHGPEALRDFYAELETTLDGLPDGAFLLNVGWGGGWEIKTVGDLLRTALGEEAFRELRRRYRLGRNPRAPFPKSRRIGHENGRARWALGWMKVEPRGGEAR